MPLKLVPNSRACSLNGPTAIRCWFPLGSRRTTSRPQRNFPSEVQHLTRSPRVLTGSPSGSKPATIAAIHRKIPPRIRTGSAPCTGRKKTRCRAAHRHGKRVEQAGCASDAPDEGNHNAGGLEVKGMAGRSLATAFLPRLGVMLAQQKLAQLLRHSRSPHSRQIPPEAVSSPPWVWPRLDHQLAAAGPAEVPRRQERLAVACLVTLWRVDPV